MIVVLGVAFGMDGLLAGKVSEQVRSEPVVADASAVDGALASWSAKLGEVLATDGWYSVDGAALPADPSAVTPFDAASALLDGAPALKPTGKAVAEKRGDKWNNVVLSNARAVKDADGTVTAVAFGIQTREQGRGVYIESKDVLVAYDKGRPTHIFTSTNPDWGGWSEKTLVTLQTDASGAIVKATEQTVRADQEWRPDADAPIIVKTASTASWTLR